LAARVSALEGKLGHDQRATVLVDGESGRGDLGKERQFTTSGGSLIIAVSGSASAEKRNTILDIAVVLDGAIIGHLTGDASEGIKRTRLPAAIFEVPASSTGGHSITLRAGNSATITDADDLFDVSVIER